MMNLPGYEQVAQIHSSANSRVYRAHRKGDSKTVIVKQAGTDSPIIDRIARLRYEFEILGPLALPGVIRALALEEHHGQPALVLEDFGGESLRTILAGKPMPIARFFPIAIRATEAIGAVHDAGIIHKDVNPANIVVAQASGEVRLIDFGIASRLPRETQAVQSPSQIEGTLPYLSPEQTGRMNRSIDYRTDLYSLGMTFYEMLTGKPAFVSNDPLEIVHGHIAKLPTAPHEINPDVPVALSEVVLKLLEKTAERRYQSAFGLLTDLRACEQSFAQRKMLQGFVAGQRDISRRLQIPQTLYGREDEIATLLAAFERTSAGATELVLVNGYSGIGKSSVVQEVQKSIVSTRGYFVGGKFDQYKRDVPYASLVQAFRQLVQQLLLESDARITAWRTNICAALGANGEALTRVLPELELVIGKQAPAPALGPADEEARFHGVFRQFLGVFFTLGHPLVVFLDDLQWADDASLKLLQVLMTRSDLRGTLVLGAYRDNEVQGTHPLMLALDAIQKAGTTPVHTLTLTPLGTQHIRDLVADTVRREDEAVRALAALLERKTLGNPFFLNQLLTGLYKDDLLRFDERSGAWDWDMSRLEGAEITDNVVDLMIGKIRKLAPETQEILKLAACTGNRFNLAILAVIHEHSEAETAAALWEALREGLVLPMDARYRAPEVYAGAHGSAPGTQRSTGYRFLHDRIQQAAYAMIPDEQKQAMRLRIGRLLWKSASGPALDAQIFDIVGHLGAGVDLVDDPAERIEIARLALAAGRKARGALAYQTAARHFALGIRLLPSDPFSKEYSVALSLHQERAECEYLSGNFDLADEMFGTIMRFANARADKAISYRTWVELDLTRGNIPGAVQRAFECLELFGIHLSPHPTWDDVVAQYDEINKLMKSRSIEDLLDLPPMTDPEMEAVMHVLHALFAPAFFTDNNLFYLHLCHMVRICLTHGNSNLAPSAYCGYGFAICCAFERFQDGYRFAQVGVRILERQGAPQAQPLTLMEMTSYWSQPISTMLGYVQNAFKVAVDQGTLPFACFCCNHIVSDRLAKGDPLEEVYQEAERRLEFVRKANFKDIEDLILGFRQYIQNMRGLTRTFSTFSDDAGFEQEPFEAQLTDDRMTTLRCWYYITKLMARYVSGDYSQALEAIAKVEPLLWASVGHIQWHDFFFYRALNAAALYEDASPDAQKSYRKTIADDEARLRRWAESHPTNFLATATLAAAELARVDGEHARAADLYEDAIAAALEQGFVHVAALAAECAGRFYHRRQKLTRARAFLTEAHQHYVAWGAAGKARQLVEKYPDAISVGGSAGVMDKTLAATIGAGGRTIGAMPDLDLHSVLKAAQAIAGEIVLPRLLERLMQIAVENAGARRGSLLLKSNDELRVEAAMVVGEGIKVLGAVPLAEAKHVCAGIVRYVERTLESVVLADASRDERFASDPYVRQARPRSILCLPVLNAGKLVGVFYLENELTVGAFSPRRIGVLRILSPYAAIAIDNSRLYAHLEDKVRDRTQELREAQGKLLKLERETAEKRMAGGFAHEIRNALAGSKLVLQKALGQTGSDSKVSMTLASARELEALHKELEAALSPPQLAQASAHIRTAFEHQKSLTSILDLVLSSTNRALGITRQILDYSKIEDRVIVRERVALHEVVRNLVAETQEALRTRNVVVRAEIPAEINVVGEEALYYSILQNLMNNARDAVLGKDVEGVIDVRASTDGARCVLQVSDNGIGIRPENRSKIFDAFFSTKPESGTGLGLAVVKKIVDASGGEIHVESDVGRGTVFTITLPTVPGGEQGAERAGRRPTRPPPPGHN